MTDWEAVVSQNVGVVHRTVYRLVGNHADAWDCIQDTFLDAVKIDRRESVQNWPALLRRLATTRALDLLRRRYKRRSQSNSDADLAAAIGREANPSSHAETVELAERLRDALGRLPRRQAEVFCLCCFDQMTSEEVAERLSISPTAARMLLSRARRRLERLLKPRAAAAEKDD